MGVDRRRRGGPHRLADLAHRRGIPALALLLGDEVEDLLALGGQLRLGHGHSCSSANVRSRAKRTVPRPDRRGKHPFDSPLTSNTRSWLSGFGERVFGKG